MYAPARHALTISAVIAAGVHLFPFRTEQLSPPAPMVLGGQPPGRVGRRRINFAKPASGRLRSFRSKCCAFAPTGFDSTRSSSNGASGGVAEPRLGRTFNSLNLRGWMPRLRSSGRAASTAGRRHSRDGALGGRALRRPARSRDSARKAKEARNTGVGVVRR